MRYSHLGIVSRSLVLAGLAACAGQIDADPLNGTGPGAPSSPTGSAPAQGSPSAPATPGGPAAPGAPPPSVVAAAPVNNPAAVPLPAGPCRPGAAPLKRLTKVEYNNTIADLLGDRSRPADPFPADVKELGFDNGAVMQQPSELLAEGHIKAADQIATRAIANLPALLGCTPTAGSEDACVLPWIGNFTRRAYRRPLKPAELDRLKASYARWKPEYGVGGAVSMVLQTVLQSPHFLFRMEAPVPANASVPLSGYEIASRLSYFLWRSMPDDKLFAAAEAGQLRGATNVVAQAARMLDDPRARDTILDFHQQWLDIRGLPEITKDEKRFPQFKPELLPLLQAETDAFVRASFAEPATLSTLFTAPFSYRNEKLARYYGAPATAPKDMAKVMLDPVRTAGVLTHGSFLAVHADASHPNPVKRGEIVRTRLLCDDLPPPPPDVSTDLPPTTPTTTNRQRYEQHRMDPACNGCHALIDPIGFAFENFDADGRWRDQDNGLPVNASGELVNAGSGSGTLSGVRELGQRLASSDKARACLVKQWFRYAHGRAEEAGESCVLQGIEAELVRSNGNVRELVLAVVKSDSFLNRAGVTAGGAR